MATVPPPSPKRQEIEALYSQNHPEKDVDGLIAKYGEDKLLSMVRKKYRGTRPEPEPEPQPEQPVPTLEQPTPAPVPALAPVVEQLVPLPMEWPVDVVFTAVGPLGISWKSAHVWSPAGQVCEVAQIKLLTKDRPASNGQYSGKGRLAPRLCLASVAGAPDAAADAVERVVLDPQLGFTQAINVIKAARRPIRLRLFEAEHLPVVQVMFVAPGPLGLTLAPVRTNDPCKPGVKIVGIKDNCPAKSQKDLVPGLELGSM